MNIKAWAVGSPNQRRVLRFGGLGIAAALALLWFAWEYILAFVVGLFKHLLTNPLQNCERLGCLEPIIVVTPFFMFVVLFGMVLGKWLFGRSSPRWQSCWPGSGSDGGQDGEQQAAAQSAQETVEKAPTVAEGAYVDGKRHGRWVFRFADGDVAEGAYVDGRRDGHWVWRFGSEFVWEGSYVNGKKHGRWVSRWADGSVWEGSYVDGKVQPGP